MKTLLTLIALGSVGMISVNAYGKVFVNSGSNSGYNGDYSQPSYDGSYYQSQPYDDSYDYQDQPGYGGGYYQDQPGYGGGYYQGQQGYDGRNYQVQPGYGGGYNNQNQPYQQAGQMNRNDQKIVSDQDITNKIRGALSSGWFSKGYENVSYQVNNGYVTLTGTVETLKNRTDVEHRITKIDGVKQVDNQITVTGKSSDNDNSKNYSQSDINKSENKYPQDFASTQEDRQINAKIRDKLSGGWFSKGYKTLVIKTTDGIVVLQGTVDKPEDAQKAYEEIKDIDGIRSIQNQIRVNR